MASFKDKKYSVAFDVQSGYDTADGSPSWQVFKGSRLDASPQIELLEPDLSTAGDGEEPQRIPGSTDGGTVSCSFPLQGQTSAYDPTAGAPTLTPTMTLLKGWFGNVHAGTHGSAIAASGSDANTWELASGNLDVGAAYATGTGSAFDASAMGFVQSYSGTTQELFEDGQGIPANADDVYAFQTLYMGSTVAQPDYLTLRMTGDSSEHDVRFIGSTPQSLTINGRAGQVPTAQCTWAYTSESYDDTAGGLLSATAYDFMPAITGAHGARLWIDGIDNSDGTAETTGTCQVGDFEIRIENELSPVECHSAQQGVSGRTVLGRIVTATFTIPWDADRINNNKPTFLEHLENGTGVSISLQLGTNAGQLMQFLIPNATVKAAPALTVFNRRGAFRITVGCGAYSGDGSSTGPGNSVCRLAFG